jgi:ribosomal protein S18 acetylase RimI-like enzyme
MEGRSRRRCIRAMQIVDQVVGGCQPAHEGSVVISSGSANAVVDVDHGEHNAQPEAFLKQAAQQGYGIGASRDRNGNPLARTKKTAAESWRSRLHRCDYVRASKRLYTAGMPQIRAATPADAAVITHHRRRMFVDAGRQDNRVLDVMAEHFQPWVETRLADGRYFGWLTTEDGKVIAGAGLIVLDWPPHPLDPRQDKRGYLLNVYVEPEHRRKKLASQLIDQALAEARRQKVRVVALHSTDAGRPLYESNGFRGTNEMFYVEPVDG